MTKKEASTILTKSWKELNSDVPVERKTQILENITEFTRKLPFENGLRDMSIFPCDMAIEEHKRGLESNPNYKDNNNPSNLLYFTLAVNNSTLPDQD